MWNRNFDRVAASHVGVDLPALRMVDRYRNWEPRDLPLSIETVIEMRTEMLDAAPGGATPPARRRFRLTRYISASCPLTR